MEVDLSLENEARLSRIASQKGLDRTKLASRILNSYLEYDEKFARATQKGLDAADRGDFIEHDEVWAQVEEILRA